jgi:hypothetical protein
MTNQKLSISHGTLPRWKNNGDLAAFMAAVAMVRKLNVPMVDDNWKVVTLTMSLIKSIHPDFSRTPHATALKIRKLFSVNSLWSECAPNGHEPSWATALSVGVLSQAEFNALKAAQASGAVIEDVTLLRL